MRSAWPWVVSRAIVGSRPFAYVGGNVGARLQHLCAALRALRGRAPRPPRQAALPQPAGSRALRLPRASTATRGRPPRADRGDLGRRAADHHASALTVLLSKLRAAVGADVLAGRGSVRVALPPDARVDVEQALAALHRAESAVVQGEWARAWSAALCARYVSARPLLP